MLKFFQIARSKNNSATIAYFLAFVALGLTSALKGPTLPALAGQTGTTLAGISNLFAVRFLGYTLGALYGGRLFDRLNGHLLMTGVTVTISVMTALIPLTSSIWPFLGIMIVIGLAEGIVDVGGNTMLIWIHGDKVGPVMNGLHFFFGAGSLLSPLIVAQCVSILNDYRPAYYLVALLILPVPFFFLHSPSPKPPEEKSNDIDQPVKKSPGWLLLGLFIFFFFIYTGSEVGFSGWIYTYTVESGLTTIKMAALLNSLFFFSFTLGRLLAIPIAARVKTSMILIGALVGCLLCVGVIVLLPGSLYILFVGTFVIGLAMAPVFPTTLSYAGQRMHFSGRTSGWLLASANAGALILPWAIGQFIEPVGPAIVMQVLFGALALGLGVVFILERRIEFQRGNHGV